MIYLDSAATTLQKPQAVSLACAHAIRTMSSPGRGGHPAALAAGETAYSCRLSAASLFHVRNPEQVIFTFNATHGLNIAIHSLVHPGNRVAISGYEHNAVTRTLHSIPNVDILVAEAPPFQTEPMMAAFRRCLDQGVDAVICTHVSNVFGTILPVEELAQLCKERGIPMILDASQSAGVLPIDFEAMGTAFTAMPGHKGLYGPQGTGLLLCKQGIASPILWGGTGSESLNQNMPDVLPDRLEAGTHNVPGLAGLAEGIRFVRAKTTERIRSHEERLIRLLAEGLRQRGAEVFEGKTPGTQIGALSFRFAGQDCDEIGNLLGRQGIALRTGLHCAPLAHRTVGTLDTGTIRSSVSAFNTEHEIRRFLHVLEQVSE